MDDTSHRKMRELESASDGEDSSRRKVKRLGKRAENAAPDRLGGLSPELFNAVANSVNDIRDLVNLSLANKSYHQALKENIEDVRRRMVPRSTAWKLYDEMMKEGIPTVTEEETIPQIVGDGMQRHAATGRQFGDAMGPLVQHLDDHRQAELADKIGAASPNIRSEVVRWMGDDMRSFKPKFREKIFDDIINDFENHESRHEIARVLEDATWRGNLTHQQLDRVFNIRVTNPDAEWNYKEQVQRNYNYRFQTRKDALNGNSRTQLTDRDGPSGSQLVSDALQTSAERKHRLHRFEEAGKALPSVEKETRNAARGKLIELREKWDREDRGR